MPQNGQRDLYQEITNRVLELLDKGTVPWRSPFKRGTGDGWPKNISTGRRYRGINLFLLAMRSLESGFGSDFWLTYRQANERGGNVKKGEKSSLVVFWKQVEREDRDSGNKIKIPVLRHYHLFNVEQCDGVGAPDAPVDDPNTEPFQELLQPAAIVAGYTDGPEIKTGGAKAQYMPLADRVMVPKPEKFHSSEAYYSTLFHELSHSTGHSKRLNRELDTKLAPFGSPDYSREELVAEMSAAFLAASSGISPPTIEQSTAYIDNWKKVLKGDKRLVVLAAGAGQRSADWVLGQRSFGSNDAHADGQNEAPSLGAAEGGAPAEASAPRPAQN